MINCRYSTDEMYHEYKNGTPISEIVKKTGIKRKTWNKRFERLEKKKMETINNKNNNYSDLLIHEKGENNNGDNGDKMAENVATINTFDPKDASHEITQAKKDKIDSPVLLFISLLLIIGFLLFKWIYDKYNTSKLPEK